ncbi:MAG: fibronectin type III domain-containing protein, partial [Thermoguttaceae bacterium]|nr:fibronectin type III domain-containing protein [Thermoguttaceae bacterium]
VALELRPSSDSTSERAELVSRRLLADDAYDLDADAATAVVHIVDAEPLLRVDVDDKVAGENDAASNFGSFVVSRQSASALSSPTTLAFSLSGSAIYGIDYTLSSEASLSLDADFNGSLVIPAGATSATISIVPLDDATREELETVVLTRVESDGYGVCVNASSGTVFLTDDEPSPLVWIESSVDANEGLADGYFRLRRNVADGPTTVYFLVDASTTATLNADFSFGSAAPYSENLYRVEFGATDETVDVAIVSVDDGFYEPTETIAISLVDAPLPDWAPAPYSLTENRSATLDLADRAHPLTQAPTGLTATAIGFEKIQLLWDATPYATEYKVEISSDGGATWDVVREMVATPFFVVDSLTVNATFDFRIKARNSYGESPYTTPLRAAPVPLNPPTALTLVASSLVSTTLSWTPSHDAAAVGYIVQRSLDGATWTTLATNWRETAYEDANLEMGATWHYRVFSEIASSQRSAPSETVSLFLPLTLAETPTGLAARFAAPSTVVLSWEPSVGATSYRLERSLDGGAWTCVAESVEDATFVDSSDALDGVANSYYYRVSANNAAGRSDAS